jgi:hypothetical protein
MVGGGGGGGGGGGELLGLALRNKINATAAAKRRDAAAYFMPLRKDDHHAEKGFSIRESSDGKDRLQRLEEMVLPHLSPPLPAPE